jgi:hypothetical protein
MTQTPIERRFVRLAGAINAKAARLGLDGRVTAADLGQIFLRSAWECSYCYIGIDTLHCSFDHVVPFDGGGLNDPANMVACCMTCQRSKGVKSVREYMQARLVVQTGVDCEVCGIHFKPRYADWVRGYGRTCSRACSGRKGGETKNPAASGA